MPDQFKTSFNYLLTHKVILHMIFSNLDFFYDKVIINPKKFKLFLQNCIQTANDIAENNPEIESGANSVLANVNDFQMELMGTSVSKGIILVQIPVCKNTADCIFIALPCMREKARYFTCELSFNFSNNEPFYIAGEWAPEDGSYKHLNYGEIACDKKSFFDKIIKMVYGEKESNDGSGTAL